MNLIFLKSDYCMIILLINCVYVKWEYADVLKLA